MFHYMVILHVPVFIWFTACPFGQFLAPHMDIFFRTITNYHSVWKSIDLMKVANVCMYLFVSSSFGEGQDRPLHTIVFIMEPLCASRILHSKFMWSDVCCASLQGHMGSSASWNLFHAQWRVLWCVCVCVWVCGCVCVCVCVLGKEIINT